MSFQHLQSLETLEGPNYEKLWTNRLVEHWTKIKNSSICIGTNLHSGVNVHCITAAGESAACWPCVRVWAAAGCSCQPSENVQHSACITHVTGKKHNSMGDLHSLCVYVCASVWSLFKQCYSLCYSPSPEQLLSSATRCPLIEIGASSVVIWNSPVCWCWWLV